MNTAAGHKEPAIESYEKAITLNPRAKSFLEPRIAQLTEE